MTIVLPSSKLLTINVAAPGGAAPAFVGGLTVSELGADSIAGTDLDLTKEPFASQNSGGALTTLTLGTRTAGSDHFSVAGAVLTTTAAPVDPTYRWTGCTATGPNGTSAPFDLTITTLANFRTVNVKHLPAPTNQYIDHGKGILLLSEDYWADDNSPAAQIRLARTLTDWPTPFDGSNHFVVRPMAGAQPRCDSWQFDDADDTGSIIVDGLTFHARFADTAVASLWARPGPNSIIRNCTIRGERTVTGRLSNDFGSRAMLDASGDGLQILDNIIEDGEQGIKGGGDGAIIRGNSVARMNGDGTILGKAENCLAENNHVTEKIRVYRDTNFSSITPAAQTLIELADGHELGLNKQGNPTTSVDVRLWDVTSSGGTLVDGIKLTLVRVAAPNSYRITDRSGVDIDTSGETITQGGDPHLTGGGPDLIHGDYWQLTSNTTTETMHDNFVLKGLLCLRTPLNNVQDGQGPVFCRPANNVMIDGLQIIGAMVETSFLNACFPQNARRMAMLCSTYVSPIHGRVTPVNNATINLGAEGTPPLPRSAIFYRSVANAFPPHVPGGQHVTLVDCHEVDVSVGAPGEEDVGSGREPHLTPLYAPIFDSAPTAGFATGGDLGAFLAGYAAQAGGPLDLGGGQAIGAVGNYDFETGVFTNPYQEIVLSNAAVTVTGPTTATVTFDTDRPGSGTVYVVAHPVGQLPDNWCVENGVQQDGLTAAPAASQATAGTTQQSVGLTGLAAATTYEVSILQVGADGYRSQIAAGNTGYALVSAQFTTTA